MGLGAGVEFYGWQIAFQQPQVLHNDGIDSYIVQLVHQPHGLLHLGVEQERVDCGKDLGMVEVGVAGQLLNFG